MLQRVTRTRTEQAELETLSPQAAHACESLGRLRPEEPDEYRTCFQRDRDRILHSKSFRRLMHKTQVFLSPEGDHYRTRLTHTLEVSQIARTIARALSLNEDLTEAIALGHDLGHTPFGHTGEDALSLGIARRMGREAAVRGGGAALQTQRAVGARRGVPGARRAGPQPHPGGGGRHPLPHRPGARADPGGPHRGYGRPHRLREPRHRRRHTRGHPARRPTCPPARNASWAPPRPPGSTRWCAT